MDPVPSSIPQPDSGKNNAPDRQRALEQFLESSLESTRKSYYPQLVKQLELVRKNEQKLQNLIDSIPARLSFVDCTHRFVFVNLEYARAYGRDKQDFAGRALADIVGPENFQHLSPYVDRACEGEQVYFDTPFTTPDGGQIWLDISYVPVLDEKGGVTGFYGLSIDRTEKKQIEREKRELEARLHQAQKMEAIGTLAGGIAHDFNNILSGIFGYAQLSEVHIRNPERALTYIRKIFDNAERASLLVQQILTFSRQSDGNRQPLKLFLPIKEALKLLRSTIPKNIEIRERILSRARVAADTTQIHQVIMNLCTNAYHAMAQTGGLLTVSLEDVSFSKADSENDPRIAAGDFVRLRVEDTGPGIDLSDSDRVFEPYFTTKETGKGSGLGLAVVDGIVKRHKGFLLLESEKGQGSCFNVFLPVIETEEKRPHADAPGMRFSQGTEKILLVDDEADIRDSLSGILESQGFKVTAVEDGAKALTVFSRNPHLFDLVVTDMTMPRVTGDRLSKEILKVRPEMPIILCTGFNEHFTKPMALAAGIKAYIEKPVSGMVLSTIIRRLIDGLGAGLAGPDDAVD